MTSRQLWDDVKDIGIAVPTPTLLTAPFTSPSSGRPKEKTTSPVWVPIGKPRKVKTKDAPKEKATSKKKKREKSKLLDLQSLLAQPVVAQEELSDFGDEEPLTEDQAAEKARKKKSLRFYTSQIAQKANKRGAASRDAGGDDDVPRKERMRDRQERLMKEAEKRGQQKATELEELGGDDDVSVDMGGDDEYYQAMVAQNISKTAAKQARAEAYAEAAKLGGRVYEEEQVGTDGKRAITYAIEKNKGLMPKRKKDVRNPRVKKRKKYEEKKKKLGSMKQVYKGGEGRGGYAGELTGIKTNIVKSVKL
jgi:U3 small nucleolar RNA-associated protein 3